MDSNTIKIMTWNVGVFQPLTYLKVLGKYLSRFFVQHEFFHKQNGGFISNYIAEERPDILILQEISSSSDLGSIPALAISYPFIKFLKTWGDNNICIASKKSFSVIKTGNFFYQIRYKDFYIFPIHLYSFSSNKRLQEVSQLCKILKEIPLGAKIIVIGDTNLWERKKWFLFPNDKKAYGLLNSIVTEAGAHIRCTHRFGANIDKIFCSKQVNVLSIKCEKRSKQFMDHYPVCIEINNKGTA